jgi:hypothetical protein
LSVPTCSVFSGRPPFHCSQPSQSPTPAIIRQPPPFVKSQSKERGAPLPRAGWLAIPLPPLPEQIEIVRAVEQRLSAAHRLEETLDKQFARARAARQSLLRKAFTGHLTPQNPNDEPASALLERIGAVRNVEPKKPKGKRMSKSKSKTSRRFLLDVLREHKKPMTPEQLFREAGFEATQADLFYRELVSLRKLLRESEPRFSMAATDKKAIKWEQP